MIGRFRIQSEALARLGSASAARTLYCRSFRDGDRSQRLYTRARIVGAKLDETGINDIDDTVNCYGRLGNVGREVDLPCVVCSWLENIHLFVSSEAGETGRSSKTAHGLHRP